jgi:hypothetical protein
MASFDISELAGMSVEQRRRAVCVLFCLASGGQNLTAENEGSDVTVARPESARSWQREPSEIYDVG